MELVTGERFSDTTSGFRGFSSGMLEFFGIHYPVEYMAAVLTAEAGDVVRGAAARLCGRTGLRRR